MLAAAATPKLSSSDFEKVETAAIRVAEAVRFARRESMRTGQAWGITVDRNSQTVQVRRFDTSVDPASPLETFYHPVRRQPVDFDFDTLAPTRGVRVLNSGDPFHFRGFGTSQTLLFDARGTPVWTNNAGAATYALRSGRIRLGQGGVERTVAVAPYVGRVTIQ